MKKTRKVLSIICALAMVFTMLSAFTVVEAATPGIVVEVVDDKTTTDEKTVTINFNITGISKLSATSFKWKLTDELASKFTVTKADVVPSTKLQGTVLPNFASNTVALTYSSTEPAEFADGDTLLSVKLTANEALTAPITIEKPSATTIRLTDDQNTTYTGDTLAVTSASSDDGSFVIGYVKPAVGISTEVVKVEDGKYRVDFKLNGIPKLSATSFKWKLADEIASMFTITKADVVPSTKLQGTVLPNFASNTVALTYSSTEPAEFADGDVLLSVTMVGTVENKLTINLDTKTIRLTDDQNVTFTGDNIFADAIVIDPNGGSVTPPPAPTKYAVTVTAGEGGTATADVTEAAEGDTVTITATANEGYKVKEITVNGTAIDGNTFVMGAAAAEVVVTFEEDATVEPEKPAEVKEYTIEAPTATKDLGKEYVLDITKNDAYEGATHDKFDVVVQMFDSKGVSVGYMVYADVTVDSDISFYLVKGEKATVLVVDDCTGAKIEDANIIANKIEKN